MDPRVVVDLALDRSPYIDQSQSMSLYVAEPTTASLVRSICLFHYTNLTNFPCLGLCQLEIQLYAWKHGLKTGMYYLRSTAPADPQPYGASRRYMRTSAALASPSGNPPTLASAHPSRSNATHDDHSSSSSTSALEPIEHMDTSESGPPQCPCDA